MREREKQTIHNLKNKNKNTIHSLICSGQKLPQYDKSTGARFLSHSNPQNFMEVQKSRVKVGSNSQNS